MPATMPWRGPTSIRSRPAVPRSSRNTSGGSREPLDMPLMSRAARMLAGRHDFICFRAMDPSRPDESTIVVVEDAAIEEDGHLILFRITGSHFLWRMVRRIVGVLVKIGKGEISMEEFAQSAGRKNRSAPGCRGLDGASFRLVPGKSRIPGGSRPARTPVRYTHHTCFQNRL